MLEIIFYFLFLFLLFFFYFFFYNYWPTIFLLLAVLQSNILWNKCIIDLRISDPGGGGGGYSPLKWVGGCRWGFKTWPCHKPLGAQKIHPVTIYLTKNFKRIPCCNIAHLGYTLSEISQSVPPGRAGRLIWYSQTIQLWGRVKYMDSTANE